MPPDSKSEQPCSPPCSPASEAVTMRMSGCRQLHRLQSGQGTMAMQMPGQSGMPTMPVSGAGNGGTVSPIEAERTLCSALSHSLARGGVGELIAVGMRMMVGGMRTMGVMGNGMGMGIVGRAPPPHMGGPPPVVGLSPQQPMGPNPIATVHQAPSPSVPLVLAVSSLWPLFFPGLVVIAALQPDADVYWKLLRNTGTAL